ncbi:hypothetical protein Mal4_30200 [Maioricimonas rarisocia]|uniref:Uncharacterized protein n=1 Tax=Maioricimonas rarisocia TaxID=2528026 RepID=A0A517Z870_9PLAN|nr:hypothetical protein Mal4_30200 [Maioricimonas rarisocia]
MLGRRVAWRDPVGCRRTMRRTEPSILICYRRRRDLGTADLYRTRSPDLLWLRHPDMSCVWAIRRSESEWIGWVALLALSSSGW